MVNKHIKKYAQHHYSLGKHNLKPQWAIASYLWVWLKNLKGCTYIVSKDEQELELSHSVGGNVNNSHLCGTALHLSHDPTSPFLGMYPKEKHTSIQRHVHMCA